MTDLEFRASTERVGHLRKLLNDPTLAQAIVVLKDMRPASDLDHLTADALVSVRVLNRQIGHDGAIDLLLSLSEPLPVELEAEESTFGVDKSQFASQSQSILR